MTAEALNDCNKRDLAQLAKEKGITGWHAMRKDQLIRALSTFAFRAVPKVIRRRRLCRRPCASAVRKRRRAGASGRTQGAGRAVDTYPDTGPRLPERPDHRPDARLLLAACLLGALAHDPGAGAGRSRPGLARRPADFARHGRLERRHDLRCRTTRSRHLRFMAA